MKILAIAKAPPGITREDFQPDQIAAEAAKVWQIYTSNLLREIYLRADQLGAVLMFECANVEEVKAVVDCLPMVKAGLLDFDIIPLNPFLSLETLFAK
jgi:N-formylglutamate amidohydrolase